MSARNDRRGILVPGTADNMPLIREPIPQEPIPKKKGLFRELKESIKESFRSDAEKKRRAQMMQSDKPRHWI